MAYQWLLSPDVCWFAGPGNSFTGVDYWKQQNAVAVAAGAMPSSLIRPPGVPTQASLSSSDLQAAINSALQQGDAATAAALQDYYGQAAQSIENIPSGVVPPGPTPAGPSVWMWVAIGVGVLLLFNVAVEKV